MKNLTILKSIFFLIIFGISNKSYSQCQIPTQATLSDYNGYGVSCNTSTNGSISIITPLHPHSTFLWNTGETTNSIQNLKAGDYDVTISEPLGCSIVKTYKITEPLQISWITNYLTINQYGYSLRCWNDSDAAIEVLAQNTVGNSIYTWNDGSNNTLKTNLSAGNYTVTVTDLNGCNSVETIVITHPDPLKSWVLSTTHPSQPGLSDGSITLHGTGGVGNITYLWPDNQTSATAMNLSAGFYRVIVADDLMCRRVVLAELKDISLISSPATLSGISQTLTPSVLSTAGSPVNNNPGKN